MAMLLDRLTTLRKYTMLSRTTVVAVATVRAAKITVAAMAMAVQASASAVVAGGSNCSLFEMRKPGAMRAFFCYLIRSSKDQYLNSAT